MNEKEFSWSTVTDMEDAIIRHVEEGGYLRCLWPRYVLRGIRANATEIAYGLDRTEMRYWAKHGHTIWAASESNLDAMAAKPLR